MGEFINGIYIPSQDDLLLHYGKKGMKWKKKGEGAQGVGMAGLAPAMQSAPHTQEFNKNTERLAKLYESMTGPTSGKYAEKTKQKRAKVQKEIDELQKKNKKLNAKSEKALSFYNKPTKHFDTSEDTLLHYGKKGMKWKKHLKNAANAVIDGVENAANWVDDQTLDKNRERALKDRSDSNKRRINDPKYGKTYNTASDPVDGKKNVDVKRALRAGRDNVVPSRTREGMKQENKYIEKIRKRVKLPRVK